MSWSWIAPLMLGCLPLFCACDLTAIDGNGRRVSQQRDLADFSAVDCEGSLDVAVEQAEAFSVTVRIDSNLVKHVETRVDDDTLVIDSNESIGDTVAGPHVIVRLPRLGQALSSGSGDLALAEIDSPDAITLRLSGSGDVHFAGSAPSITARLAGSGDLDLKGLTDDVSLSSDGSGDIHARQLVAATGKLDAQGSGDIEATIQDSAEVSLHGSGDVDLFGGAKITHASTSGSGDFHQHAD